jgi:DNA-binding NarL/FixJ family response regulator
MADKIKILIADDHPIMRQGLKFVLDEHPDFSIVSEASNGRKAVDILSNNEIDVVTLDVEMPEMGGFEVARYISGKKLNTKIIFLTMYKDEHIFNEAMEVGALGYVLKENAVIDIIECIRSVITGQHYISPALSHLILSKNRGRKTLASSLPSINDLTKTELNILKLISESKTTREIADDLFISYKTVENHRSNIAKKLNLQGAHSLVKFALNNKSVL